MERVQTGVPGLDKLLDGGLPRDSSVLLSGASGTGKTILSMQYIYEGAAQFNEPGIFVALEGSLKSSSWDMQNFNWDIQPLQEKKLMTIYRMKLDYARDSRMITDRIKEELELIAKTVNDVGAKRLVVDSTTSFGIWMEQTEFRPKLFEFLNQLKDLNCTTIFTSETSDARTKFSAFGVEEFVADGVIALYLVPPNRSVFVRKMRGTNHSKNVHPFEITSKGIVVKPREQIMWEAIR